MKYPVFKAVLRCENHASIFQIKKARGNNTVWFQRSTRRRNIKGNT